MSIFQNDDPSVKYKIELEESIKIIDSRIKKKIAALSSTDFEKKYSEINSLRVKLKAKKDRLYYLNKPKPYMTDTENLRIINNK